MIDERMEATMNGDTQDPQSTAELLCLLATYEAYGTGLTWSGCLRALAARGGGR